SNRCRKILENTSGTLAPEGMLFTVQVRDKKIKQPVPVHIADGRAHVGRDGTHRVISQAAGHRLFEERSIALVNKKPVGLTVIRDKNVRPPIPIEVGAENSQGRSSPPGQPRGDGHIGKAHSTAFPYAKISEKSRRRTRQSLRP